MAFSLESKYTAEDGTILLSGVQALVRLPMDQHRADQRAGRRTATLISGYRGSPLGGLDLELQRNARLLDDHEIRFLPGVNEDLGATAIFGSQLSGRFPKPKYEGVVGLWYGKAPGVDRSGDVFKHANFAGVAPTGGVLAIAGDDATAKSSTLPSQSEAAFYDALMPVLCPGNVQEILDLGRLGVELSRYSGLWVGFKIATPVADGFGTAVVAPDRVQIVDPHFELGGNPWMATQSVFLAAPVSLGLEREIHLGRLEAAKAFAHAHGLNRIVVATPKDRLGIAAPGKTYYDVREALANLGLDDDALRRHGIRLFKVSMPFPMEPDAVKEFAHGLDEILVIEEKRAFVELFMKEILFNEDERPRIIGKHDDAGRPLVPAHGELDADIVTDVLAQRLPPIVPAERLAPRLGVLGFVREHLEAPLASERLFHFCSGCPHNRSTMVPEGSIAGAGIGCHAMAMMMDRSTVGITHMGGEGIQWVGMAPFTDVRHAFQNLGDGTLFHSGTLAIRQAVASGANITFKILYNGAVAMTGAQKVDGAMPIPELVRALDAEGVTKTIVLSDDPSKLDGVDAWDRDRLEDAQALLRDTPGTTALVYDQHCAADLRRKRRRGEAPEPTERIFINEAVCEGCGDCGTKSNCLSLFPVETELGRKTRVHQSSCNKDYSCIDGDCPSFISVVPNGGGRRRRSPPGLEDVVLPRPEVKAKHASIYMVGIGGTGVVTANQLLATAAVLEDKSVVGVDQTGLSQKGGPVVSHLKIFDGDGELSSSIAAGEADVFLGFDVLSAAVPSHLAHARADKTVAVISTSRIPTGRMVTHIDETFPELDTLAERIDAHTRFQDNVYLDAVALAEHFFGDHMPANTIVLGAAYQQGLLPLEKWSIEKAVELNGVAVETNRKAFALGRRAASDPEWLGTLELARDSAMDTSPRTSGPAWELAQTLGAGAHRAELKRLTHLRASELIDYQNVALARRYVDFVRRVADVEHERVAGATRLSEAVARGLYMLMAYKDEYEVARLHTKPELTRALDREFGPGARWQILLHPPFLRALGMKKKIALGAWFRPVLALLAKLKFLRGSPFDVFGYAHVRRVERELIDEYRTIIEKELLSLTPERYDTAVELAELPDVIRGYEELKLANVEKFRAAVREKSALQG